MATSFPKLMRSIACLLAFAGSCFAQALRSGNSDLGHPKVELYAGYSYWHPVNAQISGHYYQDVPWGAEGSLTYFVNHWLGIQAEAGGRVDSVYGTEVTSGVGLQVHTNARSFVPFAHVLFGPNYFGGPAQQAKKLGWTGTAGAGIDWVPSLRHEWLAIRLVQADYQYNYNDFGQKTVDGLNGGTAHINTFAGSGGLVARFGTGAHERMETQMTCSPDHPDVYAGDPVTVSSQFLGFDVKKTIDYNWLTTGGKISGTGETVNIDTTDLAPGDYRVSGTMSQGRRASRTASCRTAFTIRPYDPPTISCAASPSTIAPGQSATVTATATSRQNRPLTYSFSMGATGRIPSSGNSATVTAQRLGEMTVTCNVADDLGHIQFANAIITVAPASAVVSESLAPLPLQRDMCSVSFTRDRKRPARVDNEAKACLDGIALAMEREQDATLVILADHTRAERPAIAAERAVNVKQYLTAEKGIDATRIQLRSQDAGSPQVTSIFLPAGASFNVEGRLINEAQVVRHGEAYGTGRRATSRTAHRQTVHRRAARTVRRRSSRRK